MPELPEVETVCRTLNPLISGKVFSSTEILWSRTLAQPDESVFRQRVTGRRIVCVDRRAKLIVIHLDDGSAITVHLRMTGQLLFQPSGTGNLPHQEYPHLRAAFLFEDGSELLFIDIRKFGRISYLTNPQLEGISQSLGIEPLEREFTPDWLIENLSNRKRQIKPVLLDQTFIAGLGNIYVDESLFQAGIHPLSRSDRVPHQKVRTLHGAIVSILTGAVEHRGTTLRDYRTGNGQAGENRPRLLVYGSKPGTPCPVCGAPLERLLVGQRGSILCPTCQPLSVSSDTPSL